MTSTNLAQAKKPRLLSRGDLIRASDDRDKRAALLAALQRAQNKLLVGRPAPWAQTMIHEITNIFGDYLECKRIWRGSLPGVQTVFVARPDRLRTSEASRGSVTYVYVDFQTRTASKSGEEDETQRVTPNYFVGDFIQIQVARGKTGVAEVDGQRWQLIDANVDGRAWATEPPAA